MVNYDDELKKVTKVYDDIQKILTKSISVDSSHILLEGVEHIRTFVMLAKNGHYSHMDRRRLMQVVKKLRKCEPVEE